MKVYVMFIVDREMLKLVFYYRSLKLFIFFVMKKMINNMKIKNLIYCKVI